MLSVNKRIFIGGLVPGVCEKDIKNLFEKFGTIQNVDIKIRKTPSGDIDRTFAYLNFDTDESKLKKCLTTFNNTKWRGSLITVQEAKESFLDKIKRENCEAEQEKQKAAQFNEDSFEKTRESVTNSTSNQWAVGKFGRILPVMNIKTKNKKILKVNPTKNNHQIKKLDSDKLNSKYENCDTSVSSLTWTLDNESSKSMSSTSSSKSPVSKPKPCKNKSRKSLSISGPKSPPSEQYNTSSIINYETNKTLLNSDSSRLDSDSICSDTSLSDSLSEDNYSVNKHSNIISPDNRSNNISPGCKINKNLKTKSNNQSVISHYKDRNKDKSLADVNRTKKHVDDNQKRLISLEKRQNEINKQKNQLKSAFSDNRDLSTNKKIIFYSDDESSLPVSTLSNYETISASTNKKVSLFDDSEESLVSKTEEQKDRNQFRIRPELEGKAGQKITKLHAKFGNDPRFKVDPSFFDDDDKSGSESSDSSDVHSSDKEAINDEKKLSMQVLEDVIGHSVFPRQTNKKQFKAGLRYDPTKEDHKQFELKSSEKKPKKKRKLEEKLCDTAEPEELPTVSDDKFFKVERNLNETLLKNKISENQPFSVSDMFTEHEANVNYVSESDEKEQVRPCLVDGLDDLPSDECEISESEGGDSISPKNQSKFDIPNIETFQENRFFFIENDPRIQAGIEQFCRTKELSELREEWYEQRRILNEFISTRKKRTIRRIRAKKLQVERQKLFSSAQSKYKWKIN